MDGTAHRLETARQAAARCMLGSLLLGLSFPVWAQTFTPVTAAAWAQAHSPELAAIKAQADATGQGVALARAANRPSVRLGESYALSNDPLAGLTQKLETRSATNADFAPSILNHPGTTHLNTLGLSATLPLYMGGSRRDRLQAARYARRAARAQLQRAAQDIVAQALTAYATVEWARTEVHIARQALALDQRHVQTTARLRREGQIVASDHLTAVVAATRARMALAQAQAALETARASFLLALDLPPTTSLQLARMPLPAVPATPDRLIQRALSRRPDLTALQAQARGADVEVAAARARRRPVIAVSAANDWYDNYPGLAQRSWTVMASISGTLYDGGAASARTAQALDEAQAVRHQRTALTAAVAEQVADAWRNLQLAQAQRARARDAVRDAGRAAHLVRIRYGQGRTPLFDVLGSEQSLTQARDAVASATYDWRRAGIALRRAEGLGAP